jgi:hypothetical protein
MLAILGDSVINYLYSDKNIYKRLLSFVRGYFIYLQSYNSLVLWKLKRKLNLKDFDGANF